MFHILYILFDSSQNAWHTSFCSPTVGHDVYLRNLEAPLYYYYIVSLFDSFLLISDSQKKN